MVKSDSVKIEQPCHKGLALPVGHKNLICSRWKIPRHPFKEQVGLLKARLRWEEPPQFQNEHLTLRLKETIRVYPREQKSQFLLHTLSPSAEQPGNISLEASLTMPENLCLYFKNHTLYQCQLSNYEIQFLPMESYPTIV